MTNTLLPNLPPIPAYALTPLDWAAQASRMAAEYAGMPEGAIFLVEARRYLALDARIKELEAEIRQRVADDMNASIEGSLIT